MKKITNWTSQNYTKVITESLIVFKLLPSLFWLALKSWKNYEQFTNILPADNFKLVFVRMC